MVLYHVKFHQPYTQYPVWARAYVLSRLSLLILLRMGEGTSTTKETEGGLILKDELTPIVVIQSPYQLTNTF